MQSTLLTPQVLADRWNIQPDTLTQWRWNGRGPKFLKIGGRVLYRLEHVEDYEEGHLFDSTSKK